jgi:very-short-patch-repair endonuclease
MRREGDTADQAVARLATRQHGVVSYAQLREAGLSGAGIARRAAAGRLHRVHRGVYAVGHTRLSREGWWVAALLACGPQAVLSHFSAAALWGLLGERRGSVEVTVRGTAGRKKRDGIAVHRSRSLAGAVTRRHGIPVTTPARTISDLRRIASPRALRRAIRQAEVLGLPTGMEALTQGTRSDLELDFLAVCRRQRLPKPEVNARLGQIEVDFLWRDRRLVVETDGYRYHRGQAGFERDRDRDLRLRRLGYEVIRISGRQLAEQPHRIVEVLRSRLTEGGRAGRGTGLPPRPRLS